ncbi:hypothetical protein [Pseudomonas sp. F(2018)]|uniref:hypothetical protein n=1 Tax=Pseudomonas sp. F(2018) TaxID=2502240 RepID=UPI0010F6FC1F|nr:hypothetical protein [Pseudomonas sp. F(2018)]
MTRIVLHIDRLRLRGIAPVEIEALAAELQQELQRQLTAPGMSETLSTVGHQARMKIGEVRYPDYAGEGLGPALARGIVSGLRPGNDTAPPVNTRD